jgi:hypothetical protein
MIAELNRIEDSLLKINGWKISNITEDNECLDYSGYNFEINGCNVKFRKAKITPKKIGQFVTLWKRNAKQQTEPFHENDNYDFYIIATEQEQQFGLFLFPKNILIKQQVLTTNQQEGKRGFRVYADWDLPANKQAEKTKKWQTEYFIDLTKSNKSTIEKFNSILLSKV